MKGTATIGRRIPQSLARDNIEAFKPKIVSIGPCYQDEPRVQPFRKHKVSFMRFFIAKTIETGIDFKEVEEAVANLQGVISGSYSEDIGLPTSSLVNMMILDGSFILMLFTVFCGKVSGYPDDAEQLFKNPTILQLIRRDLLLLGNQVPYVVLQTLFQTSKLVTSCGLNEMVFKFFGDSLHKPDTFWEQHSSLQASNLLDLIRQTFIPADIVIVQGIGTDIVIDIDLQQSYLKEDLKEVFQRVNKYSKNRFYALWAVFLHWCFKDPWFGATAFAAFILFIFSVVHLFLAVYRQFRPPH